MPPKTPQDPTAVRPRDSMDDLLDQFAAEAAAREEEYRKEAEANPQPGDDCPHAPLMARMAHYPPDKEMLALSADVIRQQFPRISDTCPDCGTTMIAYASMAHYLAGDY